MRGWLDGRDARNVYALPAAKRYHFATSQILTSVYDFIVRRTNLRGDSTKKKTLAGLQFIRDARHAKMTILDSLRFSAADDLQSVYFSALLSPLFPLRFLQNLRGAAE